MPGHHKFTGTAAPATTPSYVGDHFTDTVNKIGYISVGTASSADWKDVTSAASGALADGDYGDIVVSASGTAINFDSAVVTAAAKTVLDDASVSAMVDTLGGASATGSGGLVRATSPTLVTPTLGVASATSLTLSGTLDGVGSLYMRPYGAIVFGFDPSSGNTSYRKLLVENSYSFGWFNGGTGLTSVSLSRVSDNHLGLSNGANAQSFSVYNVAGTDYERGVFDWQTTAGTLTIGTQKGGAGSTRAIKFVVGGTAALDISTSANATFAGSITHGSTTLLTTTAALTNGAAAATGTLLNAPASGNPTKWIPINDNGTTRYIPAW